MQDTLVGVQTRTSVFQAVGLAALTLFSGSAFAAFLFTASLPEPEIPSFVTTQTTIRPTVTDTLLRSAAAYKELANPASKQKAFSDLEALASERRDLLRVTAKTDPEKLASLLVTKSVRDTLPTEVQNLVESETVLTGSATTRLSENADTGYSQRSYHLQANGKTQTIITTGSAASSDRVINGLVTFRQAYLIDTDTAVVLDDQSIESAATTTTTTTEVTTPTGRTTAVILFKFQDTPEAMASMAPDQARATMFTNGNSINAWYKEVSGNQVALVGRDRADGDVYGWVTLPSNSPTSSSQCDPLSWEAAANQQVSQGGGSLSGYDHLVYAFPMQFLPGSTEYFKVCYWAGSADIGGNISIIQGTPQYFNLRIVPHEIGHNLGLGHAEVYNCLNSAGQRTAISSSCTIGSYLDLHDEMGNHPSLFRHYAAHRKVGLGWIPTANQQDVTASGTYTITPQAGGGAGIQALRIRRPLATTNTNYYHLEFRQPTGLFDNFASSDPAVNGVTIRVGSTSAISSGTGQSGRSYLIDATPETAFYDGSVINSQSYRDAALSVGRTFTDVDNGITIRTDSVSATSAQVTVTIETPTCVASRPTVYVNPTQAGYDGQPSVTPQSFVVTNTDNSLCAASDFTVSGGLPVGWTQIVTPSPAPIQPGVAESLQIAYQPPAGTLAGVYPITQTISHGGSNTNDVTVTTTYTVLNAETTPPAVTITQPAANSQLPAKGKVAITATAQDASGVATIRLYIDNALVKTCTAVTSCQYSWLMSSRVAKGQHVIKAIATDASPRANTSTTQITVTK